MKIIIEYKWEVSIWEIDNSKLNYLELNDIIQIMLSSVIWANNKFNFIIEKNIKKSNTIWDLFNIK